jgi:hypothetical protein
MKIKKFNESFDWNLKTILIKDILLELKHEYPGIKGDLTEDKEGIYCVFNIEDIKFKGDKSLERFQDINRFHSLLLEVLGRIEDALNTEIKIIGDMNIVNSDKIIRFLIVINE